jgi:hypothetical protein
MIAARVALLLSLSAAACAASDADDLVVTNGTTLLVTLVVNGAPVRAVPPHSQEIVLPRDLPPLPWNVETRTSSGRVLSAMTVRAGDVLVTSSYVRGDAVRVDLSCGRLDVVTGPPLAGPSRGLGTPGDCDP